MSTACVPRTADCVCVWRRHYRSPNDSCTDDGRADDGHTDDGRTNDSSPDDAHTVNGRADGRRCVGPGSAGGRVLVSPQRYSWVLWSQCARRNLRGNGTCTTLGTLEGWPWVKSVLH